MFSSLLPPAKKVTREISNFIVLIGSLILDLMKSSSFSLIEYPFYSNRRPYTNIHVVEYGKMHTTNIKTNIFASSPLLLVLFVYAQAKILGQLHFNWISTFITVVGISTNTIICGLAILGIVKWSVTVTITRSISLKKVLSLRRHKRR